jgi:putative membrane protein
MLDSAIFAFLHHLAAFTMVAALAVEFVLIRGELTLASARMIQRTDIVYGVAATILVVVGFLRVFYFEKGSAFYFSSGTFMAKISLFFLVALISLPPTLEFLKWRKATAQGQVPVLEPKRLARIRRLIHIELAGVVLILLFAALMARGIGSFN